MFSCTLKVVTIVVLTMAIVDGLVSVDGYGSTPDGRQSAAFVENGISIVFEASPFRGDDVGHGSLSADAPKQSVSGVIRQGGLARISFTVKDAYTGAPIKGLLPDSFIQHRPDAKTPAEINASVEHCRFRALRRGRLHEGHAPMLENVYVMCLNSGDNSISVINPLMRPTTIVKRLLLGERCVDLGIDEYGDDLYVTAASGRVIVIDCNRLEITGRIDVGANPYHVAFQPDGRYVWVGNDGDGTVSVIDSLTKSLIKDIRVGAGHHEIAFTDDSRKAYVTNSDDDSVTVIDVGTLAPAQTLQTGKNPRGLIFSSLSRCIYIANAGSGSLSVLDTDNRKMVDVIRVGRGVRTLALDENGRYCLAVNKLDNSVSVVDVSRGSVVKTVATGVRPESIVVSRDYAYIRNAGSPDVTAIKLKGMVNEGEIEVGTTPPNSVDLIEGHLDIGGSYAVVVPDPVDNIVYTIMFGDDETAFKYKVEGERPAKIAFYWTGLKETAPGVYSRVARFAEAGRHEVGLYIDSPETTACFGVDVDVVEIE